MNLLSDLATPALLYIDPNSGGLIMQFLLPMFVGIGAAWVFLKDKISNKVSQMFGKSPKRDVE